MASIPIPYRIPIKSSKNTPESILKPGGGGTGADGGTICINILFLVYLMLKKKKWV